MPLWHSSLLQPRHHLQAEQRVVPRRSQSEELDGVQAAASRVFRYNLASAQPATGHPVEYQPLTAHTRRPQPQQTVAKQFRSSLHELIESVRKTRPRFVRCIKSNEKATPRLFNTTGVLRQLRYAGVIAALNMRRAGYPSRCVTATHTRTQRERERDTERQRAKGTHTPTETPCMVVCRYAAAG